MAVQGKLWGVGIGPGDPELVTVKGARDRAVIATRQYAKSQRSWFRNRMRDWTPVAL